MNNIAKLKNIKVITFGKSKRSDVHLIRIEKYGEIRKIIIRVKNTILKLKIKNINFYNVLASLAVLKKLNLDFKKNIQMFNTFQPSEGRGKIYKIKRYKKNFNLIDES